MIAGTSETIYDRVQFRDRDGMPITGILASTLMQAPWCVTADDGSGVPLNDPATGLLAGLQIYSYMPSGLDRGMFDISYMPPLGLNGPLFITIHGNVLFPPGTPEADSDYVSGPHTLSWWLPAIKTSSDFAGDTSVANGQKIDNVDADVAALNDLSQAQAQAAAAAALAAHPVPTVEQMNARTLLAAQYATAAGQTNALDFEVTDYAFDEWHRPVSAHKTYRDGMKVLITITYTAQGKSLYREEIVEDWP